MKNIPSQRSPKAGRNDVILPQRGAPGTSPRIVVVPNQVRTSGVFGSTRIMRWLADVVAGRDSLDIVTIGDSNAAYSTSLSGWTGSWSRAFHSLGAQMYASPLFPALCGVGGSQTGTNHIAGMIVQYPTFAGSPPSIGSDSGGTATAYALASQSGAVPDSLKPLCIPDTTLRPFALAGWNAVYLPASANAYRNFTQYIGHSGSANAGGTVSSGAEKTFIQNGGTYRHRAWYASLTPNTPDGSFTIQVRNTSTGTDLVVGTAVPTHDAGYDILNASAQFTASLTGTNNIRGGWAYLALAQAPVCAFWESWERPSTKGFAVQNLHSYSGASSTTISTDIANSGNSGSEMLDNYLYSLYQRQVACGGSGRVLIHFNAGINNGGDSFATWKASAEAIQSRCRQAWAAWGLDSSLLGFCMEVTHPLDTGFPTYEANMKLARAGANGWAGSQSDTIVNDLSLLYKASEMTANGYYDSAGAGEAHLSSAGYLNVRKKAIQYAYS